MEKKECKEKSRIQEINPLKNHVDKLDHDKPRGVFRLHMKNNSSKISRAHGNQVPAIKCEVFRNTQRLSLF